MIDKVKLISNGRGVDGAKLEINGQPMPFKKIKIRGTLGRVWMVDVQLLAKDIEVEIGGKMSVLAKKEKTKLGF